MLHRDTMASSEPEAATVRYATEAGMPRPSTTFVNPLQGYHHFAEQAVPKGLYLILLLGV